MNGFLADSLRAKPVRKISTMLGNMDHYGFRMEFGHTQWIGWGRMGLSDRFSRAPDVLMDAYMRLDAEKT